MLPRGDVVIMTFVIRRSGRVKVTAEVVGFPEVTLLL